YYNEEDFIQTNLYVDNMPVLIEAVPEATHVKVSFTQNNEDASRFTDEALDGAAAGHGNVIEEEKEAGADEADESEPGSVNGGKADDSAAETFDFSSMEAAVVLDTSEFTDQDLFTYQGINENGAFTAMDDMATTRGTDYDGDLEYAINQSAVIA